MCGQANAFVGPLKACVYRSHGQNNRLSYCGNHISG